MHRLISIVATSLLIIAACGADPGQDIADVEEMIRVDVFASTQVETRVSCPEHATVEPRASFGCYVSQANGMTGIALVTIDDGGAVTFEPLPNPP